METMKKNLKLGRIDSTITVNDKITKDAEFSVFVYNSLRRHQNCDWGDLGAEDRELNEIGMIEDRERGILSRFNYEADRDLDIYIITERDRSVTTIL